MNQPILQVRIITTPDHAHTLIHGVVQRATALLGPGLTYRTQTRSARRTGHVRVYLTATRKEDHADDHNHG